MTTIQVVPIWGYGWYDMRAGQSGLELPARFAMQVVRVTNSHSKLYRILGKTIEKHPVLDDFSVVLDRRHSYGGTVDFNFRGFESDQSALAAFEGHKSGDPEIVGYAQVKIDELDLLPTED